jgi:hypothetical protein
MKKVEMLDRDKHSSLFALLVSYEEKTCQLSPGLTRKLRWAGTAGQGQTLQLIWPICKLLRKKL